MAQMSGTQRKIFPGFLSTEMLISNDVPSKADKILQEDCGFSLWYFCYNIMNSPWNYPDVYELQSELDGLKKFKRISSHTLKKIFLYRLKTEIKERINRGHDPIYARLEAFKFLANEKFPEALNLAIEKNEEELRNLRFKGTKPKARNIFELIWMPYIMNDRIIQFFDWLDNHGMYDWIPGKISEAGLQKEIQRYDQRTERLKKIIEEGRQIFENKNNVFCILNFNESTVKYKSPQGIEIEIEPGMTAFKKTKQGEPLQIMAWMINQKTRSREKRILFTISEDFPLISFPDGSKLTLGEFKENQKNS